MEQLLTAEEVASILRVSPSAIFKWAKKRIIPSYRIHEKCLRFKEEDIKHFIERGKEVELSYRRRQATRETPVKSQPSTA